MAHPAPAPQPNIPALVASFGTIAQEMTNISTETANFANVGQVNIAAQLAQLIITVNALVATVAANHNTATANHAALTAIVNANHATVLQRIADVDTK